MIKKDYITENTRLLDELSGLITQEDMAPESDAANRAVKEPLDELIIKWTEEIEAVSKRALSSASGRGLKGLWFILKKNRDKRLLGKKNFSNLIKAFERGGAAEADRLLARASDGALLANACTALSRHLAQANPVLSADYAGKAWKNDPQLYRLKWYAFKLNSAANYTNALAILRIIRNGLTLSDSETRALKIMEERYLEEKKEQQRSSFQVPERDFRCSLSTIEMIFDVPEAEREKKFAIISLQFDARPDLSSVRVAYGNAGGIVAPDALNGCVVLPVLDKSVLSCRFLIRNGGKDTDRIFLAVSPMDDVRDLNVKEAEIEFQDELPQSACPVPIDEFHCVHKVEAGTNYLVNVDFFCQGNADAGFLIEMYDSGLNKMLPSTSLSINPEMGNYVYIVRGGTETPSFSLFIDKNVCYLKITGRKWSKKGAVQINNALELISEKNPYEELARLKKIVEAIPEDAKVFLLYASTASIGYEKPIKLRSARLAQFFSENGCKVLYCTFNDPGRLIISDNLFQAGPKQKFEIINLLSRRKGPNNCLYISSFTDVNSVGVLNRARNMGWRTVFELRDDMEEMWAIGISRWYNPAIEKYVASHVDKLVAVSWRLQNRLNAMTGRDDAILSPNGVSEKFTAECGKLRTAEASAKRSESRIIGYLGSLNQNFFDWALLKNYASHNPEIRIEIIGNGWPEKFELPENIVYLGEIYHDDSLEIVSRWSAGLIPFIPSRLTWAVSPNKAYEYLAMGLRVISAPMGRVHELPLTRTYVDLESFAQAISECFSPVTEAEYKVVDKFLQTDSWRNRFEHLAQELERA